MDGLVGGRKFGKRYGQVVVGPPGSGKTTYCKVMSGFLRDNGRPTIVCNLDPGNKAAAGQENSIDICELISLIDAMEKLNLGPNGEYLEENIDWLIERLQKHKNCYVLLDLPGQVELWTHNSCLKNIVASLTDFNLTCVHLVDSYHVRDVSRYISVLMLSLSSMLMLQLPHVNVLSKVDVIEQYGELPYAIEIYANPAHLSRLLHYEAGHLPAHLRDLTEAICELIQEYDLVYFEALDVADVESVMRVAVLADKAGGYIHRNGEDLRGAVVKPYGYDSFERIKDKYNL